LPVAIERGKEIRFGCALTNSGTLLSSIAMAHSSRPLPSLPPKSPNQQYFNQFKTDASPDMYPSLYPYYTSNLAHVPSNIYDEPTTTLRGGTLLHKGFYDLLAMIPTPSPSRLFWGAVAPAPVIAGPRYEDIPQTTRPPIRGAIPPPSQQLINPSLPKKGKRISKDMVSNPIGFL
jgi:protein-serine/threonine kinase